MTERRLAAAARGRRARERDAARAARRAADWRELVRALRRRPGLVLAARDRGHGARVLAPWTARLRRLARAGVDDVVPRRQGLDRAQLRPPLGRADARRARGGRPRRGRRAQRAHLRRALARGDAARGGARRLGVRAGRPRRDLPADVAGGRRSPRTRCAHVGAIQVPIFSGFAAPAVAQRLEASEAKVVITRATSTRRGKPVPMLVDPRGGARERRRRARGARAVRRFATSPGDLPRARGRVRDAVPAHLHLRHDRRAEGRRARAGRLPRLDRARGRLPGRRPRGRRRPLRHRHGLDHGAVDGRRRRRARRDDRLRRGRARLAAPTGSGGSVEQERVTSLGLSPTLVRALLPHGEPTADLSSLRTFVTTGEPWNPEPYRWLYENVGRPPRADHQLLRAAPRSARASSRRCRRCRSRRARSAGRRSGWRWTSSTTTATRSSAPARSASSSAASRSRDDARLLARPGALPRHLLAPSARASGCTATGPPSTRTASGSCTGAPTTRSTSRASGSGRPSSSRPRSRIRPCARRPRSACRTR